MKSNFVLLLIFTFSIAIHAVPKTTTLKTSAPQQKIAKKKNPWYRHLSAGLGLDIRREEEINKNDANYKVHYTLHADRLWEEKWLAGMQYSYSQDKTSSGSLKIGQQNHELMLRGLARVYILTNGAFWTGLAMGYEKTRTQLTIESDNQTRWGDWSWVVAPEFSYRHRLTENFWLQESLAYFIREYREDGEWSFAIRIGTDFSGY